MQRPENVLFVCTGIDTPNKLFTPGKTYRGIGSMGGLIEVRCDNRHARFLSASGDPVFVVGSAGGRALLARFTRTFLEETAPTAAYAGAFEEITLVSTC